MDFGGWKKFIVQKLHSFSKGRGVAEVAIKCILAAKHDAINSSCCSIVAWCCN